MRYLLFILVVHYFTATAQDVVMKNNKLLIDGNVYATYEEMNTRKPRISFQKNTASDNNPESTGANFSDYIFSVADRKQIVFATAKVMAGPDRGRLVYYYNIQFSGSDDEINIEYHPFAINNLANDMVRYKLIQNNDISATATERLVKKWNRKPSAIGADQLTLCSKAYYNNSIYHRPTDLDKSPVNIRGKQIYYGDSLIGSYELGKALGMCARPGTSKGDFYYFLYYPDGKLMAEVSLTNTSAYMRVWPAPDKDFYKVYTAERVEENMIKATTISLLERSQRFVSAKQ